MKGKIIKGIGGFYYVKTTDGLIECKEMCIRDRLINLNKILNIKQRK